MKWVLDAGSGHNPWPQANILCDLSIGPSEHRSRKIATIDERPFICCDIQALPFKSRIFSFAYCNQVIEHTNNPDLAIKELQRVGEHGYLEVPSKFLETYMSCAYTHLWIIDFKKREHKALVPTPIRRLFTWFWSLNLRIKLRQRIFMGLLKKLHYNSIRW